jgi:hypothetical protein
MDTNAVDEAGNYKMKTVEEVQSCLVGYTSKRD